MMYHIKDHNPGDRLPTGALPERKKESEKVFHPDCKDQMKE